MLRLLPLSLSVPLPTMMSALDFAVILATRKPASLNRRYTNLS